MCVRIGFDTRNPLYLGFMVFVGVITVSEATWGRRCSYFFHLRLSNVGVLIHPITDAALGSTRVMYHNTSFCLVTPGLWFWGEIWITPHLPSPHCAWYFLKVDVLIIVYSFPRALSVTILGFESFVWVK